MFPPLDSKLLDCAMFLAVQCSLVSISETLPRFEAVFGLIASEVLFFSFLFFFVRLFVVFSTNRITGEA